MQRDIREWVSFILLTWAALAQIAPGVFQMQGSSLSGILWVLSLFFNSTVGWVLFAIVGMVLTHVLYDLKRQFERLDVWVTAQSPSYTQEYATLEQKINALCVLQLKGLEKRLNEIEVKLKSLPKLS